MLVLSGLGDLACFALPSKPYSIPHRSALQALQSDWRRIGGDFKAVMAREHALLEKTSQHAAE